MEKFARMLLRRYGVVFRRLLERESFPVTWYELGRIYRRWEARGEIRGGYFVGGISGEQFALPEAIGLLRSIRKASPNGELITLSAADPLEFARYSHTRSSEFLRSPQTAFCFATDCLSLRSRQARFENCPTSTSLICKSKTPFESANCGRRCARITSEFECHSERSRRNPVATSVW